jgi:hypothetical protein
MGAKFAPKNMRETKQTEKAAPEGAARSGDCLKTIAIW